MIFFSDIYLTISKFSHTLCCSQQLGQFSQRQILSVLYRFCNLLPFRHYSLLYFMTDRGYIFDVIGAESGRHTSSLQFGFWWGCCKWCHFSGAFQSNPEFWSPTCWCIYFIPTTWKFLILICYKYSSWNCCKFTSFNIYFLWCLIFILITYPILMYILHIWYF